MVAECRVRWNLLEMFRGNVTFGTKELVNVDEHSSHETEEEAKSKHNGISNTLTQRSLASKVGVLTLVLEEGGRVIVDTKGVQDCFLHFDFCLQKFGRQKLRGKKQKLNNPKIYEPRFEEG